VLQAFKKSFSPTVYFFKKKIKLGRFFLEEVNAGQRVLSTAH